MANELTCIFVPFVRSSPSVRGSSSEALVSPIASFSASSLSLEARIEARDELELSEVGLETIDRKSR